MNNKKRNNKKRVYRVAKGGFWEEGPYQFLNRTKDEDCPIIRKLDEINISHEWMGQKCVPLDKFIKIKEALIKNGEHLYHCPGRFGLHRPGFSDDPVLVYNLRKKDLICKGFQRKFAEFRSVLESKDDFKKWFNDKEEWLLLEKLGFNVYEEVVPADKVVSGQKQSIIIL
jgi:hypothetical protein